MANYLGTLRDEKGNNFYPYGVGSFVQTFTVDGDANTYYPVLFQGIKCDSREFSYKLVHISRYYADAAPDTWYSSTHRGGLTLTLGWTGDSSWGGNDHDIRCFKFHERYASTVAGWAIATTGLIVWLRGGSALYRVSSNFTCLRISVKLDGYTDGASKVFSARSNVSEVPLIDRYATFAEIYPVGAIYMSVDSTNPSSFLGGQWELFGPGRTLVCVNNSDTVLNASKKTGGSTNPLTKHTHIQNAHGHTFKTPFANSGGGVAKIYGLTWNGANGSGSVGNIGSPSETGEIRIGVYANTATNQNTGSNTNHANWQPFITCYVWVRVA